MPIEPAQRAERTWLMISRNPASVEFTKPKIVTAGGTLPAVKLPPQVVRIASDSRASAATSTAGAAPVRQVVVFGVTGHPDATILDIDMQEGYIFTHDKDHYRCVDVLVVPGGRQGIFVATG